MIQLKSHSHILNLSFQDIIDRLPCYLTIQDRDFKIIFSNQTFKNDFGDRISEYCHMVYKDSSSQCDNCPVKRMFEDNKVHISEQTFKLAGGKIQQMLVNSVPISDDTGNIVAAVEFAINITNIKQTQKELTALGQSIAFLSHGIKNILEGLQGGAYVVDEGIKSKNMPLAIKGWNVVKKNIFDITDVVQNVLFVSKNRSLKYKKVSPFEMVKGSVELFREKAMTMGIDLLAEAIDDLPRVKLDSYAIRRMLNNLIWNALEACEKDTRKDTHFVAVRTGRYDKSNIYFEVEDNGMGMEKKIKKNIFEEYFSTKGSSGTGLGLAVVEKVVNKHGGKIELESRLNQGTLFRIILKKQ